MKKIREISERNECARLVTERSNNLSAFRTHGSISVEELKQRVQQGHFELGEEVWSDIDLQELLDELRKSHAYYLNTKLPEIEQSIHSLFHKQTDSDELLLLVCGFFISYQKKLIAHIQYEEVYLFPYIQALISLHKERKPIDKERFGNFSLKQFHENHTDLEHDLEVVREKIQSIIGTIQTPLPFRIFMNQLEQFELDLALHATLEDDLLVPMMLRIEDENQVRE